MSRCHPVALSMQARSFRRSLDGNLTMGDFVCSVGPPVGGGGHLIMIIYGQKQRIVHGLF